MELVSGSSVTVTLLDAQRYGELDRAAALPPAATPDRSRLPVGFVQSYITNLPPSKPLSSLVGKVKATRHVSPTRNASPSAGGNASPRPKEKKAKTPMLSLEELQVESLFAFRTAMGLVAPNELPPASAAGPPLPNAPAV